VLDGLDTWQQSPVTSLPGVTKPIDVEYNMVSARFAVGPNKDISLLGDETSA